MSGWRAIHKLVYVAVVLVAIHYVMLVKVDLVAPLVYALVVIFLLGARWVTRRSVSRNLNVGMKVGMKVGLKEQADCKLP